MSTAHPKISRTGDKGKNCKTGQPARSLCLDAVDENGRGSKHFLTFKREQTVDGFVVA